MTLTPEQVAEAVKLLRDSPTRQAVDQCCDKSSAHRYWPWRRRVETFLESLAE